MSSKIRNIICSYDKKIRTTIYNYIKIYDSDNNVSTVENCHDIYGSLSLDTKNIILSLKDMDIDTIIEIIDSLILINPSLTFIIYEIDNISDIKYLKSIYGDEHIIFIPYIWDIKQFNIHLKDKGII